MVCLIQTYVWRIIFLCVTDFLVRVRVWRICMCPTTHLYVRHVSFISVTRLFNIHMCKLFFLNVWNDFIICVYVCVCVCCALHRQFKRGCVWHDSHDSHDSAIHVTWLVVWHDSAIHVTWLIHMCDMTHSYVWLNSFIRVTWLSHTCAMTHSYVWHVSSVRV